SVCEGQRATLLPPTGTAFPSADAGVSVFISCGLPLPILSWSPERIDVQVSAGTPSGCVWLGRVGDASSRARAAEAATCFFEPTRSDLRRRLQIQLPALAPPGAPRLQSKPVTTECGRCSELCTLST